MATCYGGRNLRVSKAFVEAWKSGQPKSFEVLEAELLNGQKLQGVQTSDEVQEILRIRGWEQVCTGVRLADACNTVMGKTWCVCGCIVLVSILLIFVACPLSSPLCPHPARTTPCSLP